MLLRVPGPGWRMPPRTCRRAPVPVPACHSPSPPLPPPLVRPRSTLYTRGGTVQLPADNAAAAMLAHVLPQRWEPELRRLQGAAAGGGGMF